MHKFWKISQTYKTFFGIFAIIFFSVSAFATTFQKMTLDKLIEDSHAAAEVSLKEKKSYINKMGIIMTDYFFNISESHNVLDVDLDRDLLKITLTGGTVGDLTSFIDGAPEFIVGEKSFLLLKKIESKIYISNFTIGKYQIEEIGDQKYYRSSVFPLDSELGKIKKERMIEIINLKFKQSEKRSEVETVINPVRGLKKSSKVAFSNSNREKRIPAQTNNAEIKDELFFMWVFFVLFMASGFVIWWKLRQGVRE